MYVAQGVLVGTLVYTVCCCGCVGVYVTVGVLVCMLLRVCWWVHWCILFVAVGVYVALGVGVLVCMLLWVCQCVYRCWCGC